MSRELKKTIQDPEILLQRLGGVFTNVFKAQLAEKTKEWEGRGKWNTVRSSNLGTCGRKSYYAFYDVRDFANDPDPMSEKRMFFGQLAEDLMERDLAGLVDEGAITKLHFDGQNEFPINLESPESDKYIEYRATTDGVFEIELEGKTYLIPVEVKSTGGFKHFEDTQPKPHQLNQLLHWIFIAKEMGLNIPFGFLATYNDLYTWRRWKDKKENLEAYDSRVFTVAVDQPFHKTTRTVVDWNVYQHYVRDERKKVDEHIRSTTLPDKPDLPSSVCNWCKFKSFCFQNINTPEYIDKLDFKKAKKAVDSGKHIKEFVEGIDIEYKETGT